MPLTTLQVLHIRPSTERLSKNMMMYMSSQKLRTPKGLVPMLVFLIFWRAGGVASKLVVALDLWFRKNQACLEVCSQVNGAEVALERRDPTYASMKVGLADCALPERLLKGPLFLEDHIAKTLRLTGHVVKEPLNPLDLVGSQLQPPRSHCIEHVARPRIAI